MSHIVRLRKDSYESEIEEGVAEAFERIELNISKVNLALSAYEAPQELYVAFFIMCSFSLFHWFCLA